MEHISDGWVIVNIGHPRTGNKYVCADTFSRTRTEAIKKFVDGSGSNWNYWKNRYNFRAVRATSTIITYSFKNK